MKSKPTKNEPVFIVLHCSATRENMDFTEGQINASHIQRGIADSKGRGGYHYYIRKNGNVIAMRPEEEIGAHDNCKVPGESYSYNYCSIGICYEGGLDANGKAKDTRTDAQKKAMDGLVQNVCSRYPIINVLGHRDTSPDKNNNGIVERCEWLKECPCFEVKDVYTSFLRDTIVKP